MSLNYDALRLHELLKSFHVLTQMRIAIFSPDFVKIAEYPSGDCEFCTLIRQEPSAEKNCHLSDHDAFELCREQNRIYSYTCHAGLMDVIAPINHGSAVIGYMMFGQLLPHADKDECWPDVKKRCQRYSLNEQALKEAFYKIKPTEMEQITALALISEVCAGYLWYSLPVPPQENSLPLQIDVYISDNIAGDLSAAALCEQFKISRSKLYRITKEYFGMGIERLVKMRRISKATTLLTGASIPISEIAQRVGIHDYNYFIKIFKAEVGLTPLRYRKQQQ